jgi:hypothetical protein
MSKQERRCESETKKDARIRTLTENQIAFKQLYYFPDSGSNQLNDASIATRYPEDFSQMLATYNDALTDSILIKTEEALVWIKQQL